MSWGYRIATLLVFGLLAVTFFASYFGWGVPSDASARAASVRQGGIHGRRYIGGGPGFGK